jgi:hypothetical protein
VFPVDHVELGPRAWGQRKGTRGIVFHTTEAAGRDLAAARATARWQAERTPTGGWRNPGSYNFIIATDGVLLTVPYLETAGGLNPASPYWAPGRFPWLRELLGERAYADPNAYLVNVAFSGRTAHFERDGWPASMIEAAARLVVWIEAAAWGRDNLALVRHADFQTNRSDPGTTLIPAVLARYAELTADDPEPPPTPEPVDWRALYRRQLRATRELRAERNDLAGRIEAARTALTGGPD